MEGEPRSEREIRPRERVEVQSRAALEISSGSGSGLSCFRTRACRCGTERRAPTSSPRTGSTNTAASRPSPRLTPPARPDVRVQVHTIHHCMHENRLCMRASEACDAEQTQPQPARRTWKTVKFSSTLFIICLSGSERRRPMKFTMYSQSGARSKRNCATPGRRLPSAGGTPISVSFFSSTCSPKLHTFVETCTRCTASDAASAGALSNLRAHTVHRSSVLITRQSSVTHQAGTQDAGTHGGGAEVGRGVLAELQADVGPDLHQVKAALGPALEQFAQAALLIRELVVDLLDVHHLHAQNHMQHAHSLSSDRVHVHVHVDACVPVHFFLSSIKRQQMIRNYAYAYGALTSTERYFSLQSRENRGGGGKKQPGVPHDWD